MDENKLVSGGIIFALSSIATYSYHQMMTQNKKKRKRKIMKKMSPIMEFRELQSGQVTPCNTPLSNTAEITPAQTPISKSPTNELVLKVEEPLMEIKELNEKSNEKTNSCSMSSFLELNQTGSQTDTEELEFMKLDKIKSDRKVYGTPTLIITERNKIKNTIKLNSSEKEYDTDSEDIEVSYYSEGELLKHKTRPLLNFFKFKRALTK